jgi:16S rRNA (cytidine1402-2'-O)-methyltransferase
MLVDLRDLLGDPPVVLAREVTKVHEEFVRGSASEVLGQVRKKPVKGEITVLAAPQLAPRATANGTKSIREEIEHVMVAEGLNERAALKVVARQRRLTRSEAYRQLQAEKTSEE